MGTESSSSSSIRTVESAKMAEKPPVDEKFVKAAMEMHKKLIQNAERGDAESLFILGDMHSTDTMRDEVKAMDYYRRASEKGHAEAAVKYAQGLLEGRGGVTESTAEKAVESVRTAALAGHPAALHLVATAPIPSSSSSSAAAAEIVSDGIHIGEYKLISVVKCGTDRVVFTAEKKGEPFILHRFLSTPMETKGGSCRDGANIHCVIDTVSDPGTPYQDMAFQKDSRALVFPSFPTLGQFIGECKVVTGAHMVTIAAQTLRALSILHDAQLSLGGHVTTDSFLVEKDAHSEGLTVWLTNVWDLPSTTMANHEPTDVVELGKLLLTLCDWKSDTCRYPRLVAKLVPMVAEAGPPTAKSMYTSLMAHLPVETFGVRLSVPPLSDADFHLLPVATSMLTCSVCFGVPYQPVETPCTHVFCEHCLATAVKTKPSCPNCRSPVVMSKTRSIFKHNPVFFRYVLAPLQVWCPLRHRGCGWGGDYGEVERHLWRTCSVHLAWRPVGWNALIEKVAQKMSTELVPNPTLRQDIIDLSKKGEGRSLLGSLVWFCCDPPHQQMSRTQFVSAMSSFHETSRGHLSILYEGISETTEPYWQEIGMERLGMLYDLVTAKKTVMTKVEFVQAFLHMLRPDRDGEASGELAAMIDRLHPALFGPENKELAKRFLPFNRSQAYKHLDALKEGKEDPLHFDWIVRLRGPRVDTEGEGKEDPAAPTHPWPLDLVVSATHPMSLIPDDGDPSRDLLLTVYDIKERKVLFIDRRGNNHTDLGFLYEDLRQCQEERLTKEEEEEEEEESAPAATEVKDSEGPPPLPGIRRYRARKPGNTPA